MFQFLPFASCPVTGHYWDKSGYFILISSHQVFIHTKVTGVFSSWGAAAPMSPYERCSSVFQECSSAVRPQHVHLCTLVRDDGTPAVFSTCMHVVPCSNRKKPQEVLPCSPHLQVLLYLHVHQFDPTEQTKEWNVTAELNIMLQWNMNRKLGFLSRQTNHWEGTEEYKHKG